MADKGRRIYIVGGRCGLAQSGKCGTRFAGYEQGLSGLSAEIFELDMGENPLVMSFSAQDVITKGTCHWRKVSWYKAESPKVAAEWQSQLCAAEKCAPAMP